MEECRHGQTQDCSCHEDVEVHNVRPVNRLQDVEDLEISQGYDNDTCDRSDQVRPYIHY